MSDWTPERWQEILRRFDEAAALPEEDQGRFLDDLAAGDPPVADEVRSLLRARGEADRGAFLARPFSLPESMAGLASMAGEVTGGPDRSNGSPLARGTRLGPYRIEGVIGRGGMGVVYGARRDDEVFEGEVAVKVMTRALGSAAAVERFRAERQILAELDHPFIARLLDGGSTEEGYPYLVMERVEGRPADRYCDEEGLSLDERLELFRRICQAVQHAHQRLVVHRDLKPGNILVTDDGFPRLLDFGIAKLLKPAGRFAAAVTAPGLSPMTLAAVSPEQLSGKPVTTATDLYALGVLLFELLAGRKPFEIEELSPGGYIEAVLEADPPAPSRVALEGSPLATAPDPDLDAIVSKALRKEPAARYGSAADLAADLERYRDGLPVEARAGGLAYQLGKLVRRHRWKIGAATAALVALIVFLVLAIAQQQRVLRQQALYGEATRFLEEVFTLSDPDRARGEEVTARELLERGARLMSSRVGDRPELEAELLGVMGRVHRKLALIPEAKELLERAERQRRSLYGDDSVERAEALYELGLVHLMAGDATAAERCFGSAGEIFDRRTGRTSFGAVRALAAMGDVRHAQRRYDEAIDLHREALDRAAGWGPEVADRAREAAQVARGLNQLGGLYREIGDFPAARRHYVEALDRYRQLHGEDHPEVAGLYNNLGLLEDEVGRPAKAVEWLEKAEAIQRQLYSEAHPSLATTLHNLAQALRHLGEGEAAGERIEEALTSRREVFGSSHRRVAESLNLKGMLDVDRGELDAAEEAFRRSLTIWRSTDEPDPTQEAAVRNNLGDLLRRADRPEEALPELERALELYRQVFGGDHLEVATVLNNLGLVEKKRGDPAAAEERYRQALAILEGARPDDHPDLATLRHNLAVLLAKRGELEEAERLFEQALGGLEKLLGPDHPSVAEVEAKLDRIRERAGRSREGSP